MRDLRSQLRQAEADLEGSQAAAGIAGPRDLEARLERAIGLLTDLPNTLRGLESAEQNRILSTNVDRVDVKADTLPPKQVHQNDGHTRTRPGYSLAGGTIYLTSLPNIAT